jgi:hypothetical protein
MVTVKELKKLLEDQPDHLQVFISVDGEGNDYKPLSEETWSVANWDAEDREMQHFEEDEATGLEMSPQDPNALILWPV